MTNPATIKELISNHETMKQIVARNEVLIKSFDEPKKKKKGLSREQEARLRLKARKKYNS